MTTLLLAECNGPALADVTAKALTAALALGAAGPRAGRRQGRRLRRRERRRAELRREGGWCSTATPPPTRWPSRSPTPSSRWAPGYDAFVAPSTAVAKNVMPRVRGAASTSCRSPTSARWSRPTRSSARSTPATRSRRCKSSDAKKVITVRVASFAATESGDATAPIEPAGAGGGGRRPVALRERRAGQERPAGPDRRQDRGCRAVAPSARPRTSTS